MSSHLQWMIIRNNSSFLVKRNGLYLTREPNNLKNRHSLRFNGLVRTKTVGIEPAPDNKGVVLVTRREIGARKPTKALSRVTLKKGQRRTLTSIRKILRKRNYRKEMTNAALRRASAIMKSQKPYVPKKFQHKKKKAE